MYLVHTCKYAPLSRSSSLHSKKTRKKKPNIEIFEARSKNTMKHQHVNCALLNRHATSKRNTCFQQQTIMRQSQSSSRNSERQCLFAMFLKNARKESFMENTERTAGLQNRNSFNSQQGPSNIVLSHAFLGLPRQIQLLPELCTILEVFITIL